MNVSSDNIQGLCEDFLQILDRLYQNNQITHEQYEQMRKLKVEYINKLGEMA